MNPPDRALIYRVSRGGHVMGEFDIDRIVELLDSGEFMWTDLCWHQRMSGWVPLAQLRGEIAAAKAFPPVAAMPAPVASGRRRAQTPMPQVSSQVSSSNVAGWGWVAGGVAVGAVVGLLITHLFPNVVTVDRPVEKVVIKPVEVVRNVERRVEVPAALSKEQQEAIDYATEKQDALMREVGVGATAMIPVIDKKIKVFVSMDDVLKRAVSESTLKARVETVFRRNGFTVVDEKDSDNFANTIIVAEIFRADDATPDRIEGVIRLKVSQYYLASGAFVQKLAWFDVKSYENALRFGSDGYHRLPALFENFAVEAANDLSKAGKLPYRPQKK